MSINTIAINVDSTEADETIESLRVNSGKVAKEVVRTTRQAWDTVRLFGALTGQVIDQAHQLIIDGLFIAAETIASIAAAESVTVIGALKIGMAAVASAGLIAKGIELQNNPDQGSQQLNAIIQLGMMYRYTG